MQNVSLSRKVPAAAIAVAALLWPLLAQAAVPLAKTHALWVYPDLSQPANNPVLAAAAGQQLVSSAQASHINMLYLSVYSSTPNSQGRYLYDEGKLAALLAAAHFAGIQVYAAYGDPSWPTLGCGTSAAPSFPIARIQEIAGYNATSPSAPVTDPSTGGTSNYSGSFDGIIFDVEPSTADQNLLALYQCAQQTASGSNLGMSVAISAFWTAPISSGGPAYQQIINMRFNNVVVMGYRNFAGTYGQSDNGILNLDTPMVAYANNGVSVLVGLETKNLASSDPNNTQSFYSLGQAALDYQAQSVYNQFGSQGLEFGGFAVDNYADSYLGGANNWPTSDPSFPSAVSVAPVSAGIPADVQVGATQVSVTFQSVSNSNATLTVTPLNPATQLTTPTGFQLAGLAFDVSTTATFSGVATVCFTVPSLDAATFASLRIFHYVNGAAVDQTILTAPNAPNPATQTICAAVTSFSPFVLAKSSAVPMPLFTVGSLRLTGDEFHLSGSFSLPPGATLAAGTDIMLELGTVTLKIPGSEVREDGGSLNFHFEGTVNGVHLALDIDGDTHHLFQYSIEGGDLDLTHQPEPMLVEFEAGKYLGRVLVFAAVHGG